MVISFRQFYSLAKEYPQSSCMYLDEGGIRLREKTHPDFLNQNRVIWQAFQRACCDEFGSLRLQKMCRKYNIDMEKAILEGHSFTKLAIQKMCIAGSIASLSDLEAGFGYRLDWLSPSQIHDRVDSLRRVSQLDIKDVVGKKSEYSHVDPLLFFDRNLAILWPKLSNLDFRGYVELLSKSLGSLQLDEGSILPAPGITDKIDYYRVYQKISKDGLIAYALKPLSSFSFLKPLLLFRPTVSTPRAEDFIVTLQNDCEKNIGEMGYSANKAKLSLLMRDTSFSPEGKKIDIAGYSLGGAHAQRFLVDHYPFVDKAFFFNDPAVESHLAESFASHINSLPLDSPEANFSLEIFRTKDDLVHFAGHKHIGWGIRHPRVKRDLIEFDLVERTQSGQLKIKEYLQRHTVKFLKKKNFLYLAKRSPTESIDHSLDNTRIKSFGHMLENVRSFFGQLVLFPLLWISQKIIKIGSWGCHKIQEIFNWLKRSI